MITRTKLAAMSLEDFRALHPTAAPEVLEALYEDRLVAFDEDNATEEVIADVEHACPLCGGPQQILGKLGQRVHLRCRNCGSDTNEPEPEPEEQCSQCGEVVLGAHGCLGVPGGFSDDD